jgi:hypothetical protein
MKKNHSFLSPVLKTVMPVLAFVLFTMPCVQAQVANPGNAQIIHDGQMITVALGIFLISITAWRFYRDYKDAETDLI